MRPRDLFINKGWQLQSSAKIAGGGEQVSTRAVDTAGWIPVNLPATVLGALVEHGAYPDVFYRDNLRKLPGQGPPAQNFSNHPMPDDSPFGVPWWFRKELVVPDDAPHYLRLRFDGINYRASVWLNGKRIASANDLAGAYRVHELDVTGLLDRDGSNVLALEVTPPSPCELAITWVDWNPSPPDKNMGVWRDVRLLATGPVAFREPHVVTRLEGHGRAYLTVGGDLLNLSDAVQLVTVQGEVEGRRFAKRFELAPRSQQRFDIGPDDDPALIVESPRLWWPRALGEPALYDLTLVATADGVVSDVDRFSFGIREVTSEMTERGHALLRVNGEPILVRGAGWATDLFLRRQPERDIAQLEYVKAMGLNTVRFEGMLERNEFLDWCDRDGILVIAGWCCCDCWEKWDKWNDECHSVAPESLRSQVRRVRRHPSLIAWWYGSDFPPPPEVEQRYLDVLAEERWPNPHHSSAANKPTPITGQSGLKMEGPYEYVPPNYWFEDVKRGGAFGFATEVCPGVAIPPVESVKKMMAPDELWPMGDMWKFHAGGQEFHTVHRFMEAMTARLGDVASVEEVCQLSQLMTYEAQRAMFEAYGRHKFVATGVIQWMLNNAWPSLIWHLYDWYLLPGGGYFGAKKAMEPLHAVYGYDDRAVWLVNSRYQEAKGVKVTARLLDLEMTEKAVLDATVDIAADGSQKVLALPPLKAADSPVYFLHLTVEEAGKPASSGLYWLSSKPETLDWKKSTWYWTPTLSFADFTALQRLPRVQLKVSSQTARKGEESTTTVTLENPSKTLAFFVRLKVNKGPRGEEILPVRWTDNYLSLLPGERREIAATYRARDLGGAKPTVEVGGWNVAPQ